MQLLDPFSHEEMEIENEQKTCSFFAAVSAKNAGAAVSAGCPALPLSFPHTSSPLIEKKNLPQIT
jgi:hypothetical protein